MTPEGGNYMFEVGDVMIYSSHGMCRVEDICEKTVNDVTRLYYVLLPLESNYKMTIMIPVDNDKVAMLELLTLTEAEEVMAVFDQPCIDWPDHPTKRHRQFSDTVNSGDRIKIAEVIQAYLVNEAAAKEDQNRLYDHDKKLLENARRILFRELAACLKCSVDDLKSRIDKSLNIQEPAPSLS